MEAFSSARINNFSLKNYHLHLDELNIAHHDFIKSIGRVIPHEALNKTYIDKVLEIANQDLGRRFKIYKSKIEFRVVRPNNEDNNELHRDHWFPYFYAACERLSAFAEQLYDSAMGIVPFSHDWSEEDVVPTFTYEESAAGKKYIKNGIFYSVPAVEKINKRT